MIGEVTVAGIAILVTAAATLIAAIGGVVVGLRNRGTVVEVRSMVNGTLESLRRRAAQLEAALRAHGVEVPTDPEVHP